MIPTYLLVRDVGLMNNLAAVFIPGAISTYNCIIMRQFFVGIPNELKESARIDGCDAWGEFWHIILPLIYPTITVMFIADLAGIARVDLGTFNMYGQYTDPKLYTIGYYLYNETLKAGIADYPHLATFGVFLTLIVVPVVLLVRYLLNKFGPSED